MVDGDESPAAAAIREVKEEIGIELSLNDISLFTVAYIPGTNGFLDRLWFVFKADVSIADQSLKLQANEIVDAKWVEIDSMHEYFNDRKSLLSIQQMLLDGETRPYIEPGH